MALDVEPPLVGDVPVFVPNTVIEVKVEIDKVDPEKEALDIDPKLLETIGVICADAPLFAVLAPAEVVIEFPALVTREL